MFQKNKQTVNEIFWYSLGNIAVKFSYLIMLVFYSKYVQFLIYGLRAMFEFSRKFLFSVYIFCIKSWKFRYSIDEIMVDLNNCWIYKYDAK